MFKKILNPKVCVMDYCVPLLVVVVLLLYTYRDKVMALVGMKQGYGQARGISTDADKYNKNIKALKNAEKKVEDLKKYQKKAEKKLEGLEKKQ